MESIIKLPNDMFKQELLTYLTVYDIVKLDNACMNYEYLPHLLEKINGVILPGDKSMEASFFKWLGMRRIYLIKINWYFDFEDDCPTLSSIENNYVGQFRYTQHLVMMGIIVDDMAIFIISHCPCLLSIDISRIDDDEFSSQITDQALQSIAERCTGLKSLSISNCEEISDAGLIIISELCPKLLSLTIDYCDRY